MLDLLTVYLATAACLGLEPAEIPPPPRIVIHADESIPCRAYGRCAGVQRGGTVHVTYTTLDSTLRHEVIHYLLRRGPMGDPDRGHRDAAWGECQ
jgi:hypothetical protein